MDESLFRRRLAEQRFPTPVLLDLKENTFFEDHKHRFASYALVLEGEFTIKTQDSLNTWRAGETFSLEAEVVHSSWAGVDGAKILTGRMIPDSSKT